MNLEAILAPGLADSGPDAGPMDPWPGIQRIERWVTENRINLIRLNAVAALYAYHLLSRFLWPEPWMTGAYHTALTQLVVACVLMGGAIQVRLSSRHMPSWFPYLTLHWDILVVTAACLLHDGPRSPLAALFLCVVFSSALRVSLRLVWTALISCGLAYLYLLTYSKLTRPDLVVPHGDIFLGYVCLLVAATFAGQTVRQARRIARGHPVALDTRMEAIP